MARDPSKQAQWAINQMRAHNYMKEEVTEHGKIRSIGSERTYEPCLKNLASHMRENREGDLRSVSRQQVENYLHKRAGEVGQKQLDKDRQAAQCWLSHRDGQSVKIPRSEHKSQIDESKNLANQSRIYEDQQVDRIQSRLTDKNELGVQIARETGARAHEIGTIAKPEEQPASERGWVDERFEGKNGVTYTVHGKGGLVREVKMSRDTSERLEQQRRDQPISQQDRGINFTSRYEVGKGQALSQAFTRASEKEVGWSAGLHGLRHVYAQDRLDKLQEKGYNYDNAKGVVSHEMGHFRSKTTSTYER